METETILEIIAILVVGFGSWFIAVNHTKKSVSKKKIKYRINSLAMVSDAFLLDDLNIYYQKTLLSEPIVVSLNIINAGNVALENPPIKLKTSEGKEIIPLGLSEVPPGYNDLWSVKQDEENNNICFIELEHINPNQVVKAVFILTEKPKMKNEPIFECAMKDLVLEETQDTFNNEISIKKVFDEIQKVARKIMGS